MHTFRPQSLCHRGSRGPRGPRNGNVQQLKDAVGVWTYQAFTTGLASFALKILNGKNIENTQPLKLKKIIDLQWKSTDRIAHIPNYISGRQHLGKHGHQCAKAQEIRPIVFNVSQTFMQLPAHIIPFIFKCIQRIQKAQMNFTYYTKIVEWKKANDHTLQETNNTLQQ